MPPLEAAQGKYLSATTSPTILTLDPVQEEARPTEGHHHAEAGVPAMTEHARRGSRRPIRKLKTEMQRQP